MEERVDLKKTMVEKVVESMQAGNKEDVEKYVRQLEAEGFVVKDLLVDMINMLTTYIGNEYGEEKVLDAWMFTARGFWKPSIDAFKTMTHGQVIEIFASLHRGLGSEFRVEQDDEKATIIITGCGSGGKQMKDGKYENSDRNPMNGGICKNAATCGKAGMPFYCVHAPAMFDVLPKEWGYGDKIKHEYGRQYDDAGNQVNEPCSVTIYK